MKVLSSLLLLAIASPAMADLIIPPGPPRGGPVLQPTYSPLYDAASQLENALNLTYAAFGANRRFDATMLRNLNQAITNASRLRLQANQYPAPVSAMQQGLDRIDRIYMDAARVIHTPGVNLLSNQLDAWYGVAKAIGGLRVAMMMPSDPTGPVDPMPMQPAYDFAGTFGGQPVAAWGNSPAEFMQNCMTDLRARSMPSSYTIVMGDGRQARSDYAFSIKGACGVMLLNADVLMNQGSGPRGPRRPRDPGTGGVEYVNGSIGANIAIRLPAQLTNVDLRALVEAALPSDSDLIRSVYTVTVGTKSSRSDYSFSVNGIKMLLIYNVASTYPGYINQVGQIGNLQFIFSGTGRDEIISQCLEYWKGVEPRSIYSLTVNGKQYSSSTSYTADGACRAVAAAR